MLDIEKTCLLWGKMIFTSVSVVFERSSMKSENSILKELEKCGLYSMEKRKPD